MAAVVLALLSAVTQTSLLLALTYAIPPRTCETKINSTKINSTNCTEIAAEFENNSVTESDNNFVYFRVIEVLRIVYSFMTLPEYVVLVHGLYKLLIKTSNPMHESKTHPRLEPCVYLSKLFEDLRNKGLKHCRARIGTLLALVLIIIIFTPLSLATPIMDIRYACMVNDCCKEQQLFFKLSVAYESVHLLVHLLSPFIVGGMVVTVLEVKTIWWLDIVMEDKKKDNIAESTLGVDEQAAIREYYKCVTEYKQRIAKIKPLFRVFQTWFVFQWFHYFFQTVTDFTQTIHQWITGTNHPALRIAYRAVHTAFDVLAFAIPHVCGLKLNACHQEYLRHARKKQLEAAQSKLGYVKAYSLTIEKDSDGDFVPRIPGTGIRIPLDSPGYTLGIILTIFALIASFVGFSR